MNRVTKISKKNKLSYHEYNERFGGSKKLNKQKRGKVRYNEEV